MPNSPRGQNIKTEVNSMKTTEGGELKIPAESSDRHSSQGSKQKEKCSKVGKEDPESQSKEKVHPYWRQLFWSYCCCLLCNPHFLDSMG